MLSRLSWAIPFRFKRRKKTAISVSLRQWLLKDDLRLFGQSQNGFLLRLDL